MYELSSAPRRQNKGNRKPRSSTPRPRWELKVEEVRRKSPPIGARGFDPKQLASGAEVEERMDVLFDQRQAENKK